MKITKKQLEKMVEDLSKDGDKARSLTKRYKTQIKKLKEDFEERNKQKDLNFVKILVDYEDDIGELRSKLELNEKTYQDVVKTNTASIKYWKERSLKSEDELLNYKLTH